MIKHVGGIWMKLGKREYPCRPFPSPPKDGKSYDTSSLGKGSDYTGTKVFIREVFIQEF